MSEPSPRRILLAEDYEPNARFIIDALEPEGYIVDLAVNGRIAIERALESRYTAIIMDIEMPEVDGIAATQAIRAHEREDNLPALPILGLTGHTMTSIRKLCMAAGMDDLIVKPFLAGALYDKLDALISADSAS